MKVSKHRRLINIYWRKWLILDLIHQENQWICVEYFFIFINKIPITHITDCLYKICTWKSDSISNSTCPNLNTRSSPHGGFLLLGFFLIKCDFLYCLSLQFGGQPFALWLCYTMYLRRVGDFLTCSGF